MNNTKKQYSQTFQTILDYTNEIEKKIDKSLQSMLMVNPLLSSVYSKIPAIDILCLLNELELNKKQLDIVKKHISLIND